MAEEEIKVPETKITKEDLKEWFGEEMPMSVMRYLFVDAPKEMPIWEVKQNITQMAKDFRSPENLAAQAYALLAEVKKHGNLAPSMQQKIEAWSSRYFIHRREVDAENGRLARVKEGFEDAEQSEHRSDTPADKAVSRRNANKPTGSLV